MDRYLHLKGHIKALSSKISRAIGLLKHAKRFLPRDTLKTLYTGIVEPQLRFRCSVWGLLWNNGKEPIAKASKSSGKDTDKKRHDADARPLLNTLRLKTIQDLIETEIHTMVFKALNGLPPKYLLNLFITNSESHLLALRNTSTNLRLPKKTTEV